MDNNLGIYGEFEIREMEYKLFNLKYHLVNQEFTFKENDIFSINYLEKLHIFLFSDMYGEEKTKVKDTLDEETRNEVNKLLQKLRDCSTFYDPKTFSEIIYNIWQYQIFYDGNTRTLLCFIKVISQIYNLNIEYDFEQNIYKDYFINDIIECIYNENEDKKLMI